MRVLSLTQPWATLLALKHKQVETRSWRTGYLGDVAIHAAKGFPKDAREFASEERALGRLPSRIPRGAIIAVATLTGCRHTEDVVHQLSGLERHLGNYENGRWAWFFSDIRALPEPIPCRGALGLRESPDDMEQLVRVALSAPQQEGDKT